MAETVVSFLLNQLSTLLREEGKLWRGLRQDIQDIKEELENMRAFMKIAEAREEDDPRLQEWIRQVREAAYDTEDILDVFMLQFARHHNDGFVGSISRTFSSLKNLRAGRRIASEIQQIKKRTTDIFDRHQRYQSQYVILDQVPESVAPRKMWGFNRDDALLVAEAKLVGINGPKKLLISHLLGNDPKLKVVSVLGMGGLGKTTLVKRVYEDADVRRDFQVRAWITVSQTVFEIEDLLKDLIEQLYKAIKKPVPTEVKSMKSKGLKTHLQDFLQDKRYLIVFDDVWDIDFWNNIKFALPEGGSGRRVIITTRKANVASASCIEYHGYIHKMDPLSFDESWTLFCRKTFEDHCCPAQLKQVSESILGKCEGLPLAIVAVSGFLALKDKNCVKEWEMVRLSLRTEIEGSGELDRIKQILSLSYSELPSYLKTCLLYLSVFPEDYEIQSHRLIRLWIAERFVQEKIGRAVEEEAEDYLRELINRSLVQVTEAFEDGKPLKCRIHDILREILLSKSRELNLMTVATAQHLRWPENVRRLVIHSCLFNTQEGNCFKHLRSLITFGSTESLSKSVVPEILRGGSRLLKILDLRNALLDEIPEEVFNLFHLRYLCLRETRVKVVPKAIGKLENLEYFDLSDTRVSELSKEILKLRKLRHLILVKRGTYSDDYENYGFKAPYEIGRLLSLQYLYSINVDTNNIIVREIGKLTQLRTLGIGKLRNEDGKKLCSSLEKLNDLVELSVSSIQREETLDLDHCLFSGLQFLQRLYIWGRLEKLPQWIPSLQSLSRINLYWSELKDDPLESLQNLPNLLHLYLNQAYQGEGLYFKAGGFLKLKLLSMRRIEGMKWLRVEEGAMPHLEELYLSELKLLEELPSGIQHLSNLKFVRLNDMSENLRGKLMDGDQGSEEHRKIAHVPEVVIAYLKDNEWQWSYLSKEKND